MDIKPFLSDKSARPVAIKKTSAAITAQALTVFELCPPLKDVRFVLYAISNEGIGKAETSLLACSSNGWVSHEYSPRLETISGIRAAEWMLRRIGYYLDTEATTPIEEQTFEAKVNALKSNSVNALRHFAAIWGNEFDAVELEAYEYFSASSEWLLRFDVILASQGKSR